jgi:DNA-directed RNA polymerase specialized sigma24 family protein
MHRIADREPAALAELCRLQARPVFGHVRARIDDFAAAAAITRAVFVEMWRLAPARRQLRDPRSWLLRIADRRIADHQRSRVSPAPLRVGYDEHIRLELYALVRSGLPDDSDTCGDSAAGPSRMVVPRDERAGRAAM